MHHFFADPSCVEDGWIRIEGADAAHMGKVLRMRPGESLLVSDGKGRDYLCQVEALEREYARVRILEERQAGGELPARIWLFQGLPKSDKMDLIVQKAVELGAFGVVPTATKNAVVKLDEKKGEAKVRRWQAIARSAAEQSKRSCIPRVLPPMSLEEAFAFVRERQFGLCLIPYEEEQGMESMREALAAIGAGGRPGPMNLQEAGGDIGVFIGPEGGFDPEEVRRAIFQGIRPVSLGRRILRTETAGLAVLSLLMMKLEGAF